MKKNNKIFIAMLVIAIGCCSLTGCETQADKVSYNLSQEADNFNVVRQLTVINCIQGGCIISNDWKNVYYFR